MRCYAGRGAGPGAAGAARLGRHRPLAPLLHTEHRGGILLHPGTAILRDLLNTILVEWAAKMTYLSQAPQETVTLRFKIPRLLDEC